MCEERTYTIKGRLIELISDEWRHGKNGEPYCPDCAQIYPELIEGDIK